MEEINEVKGHYNTERKEREKAEGEIKEVTGLPCFIRREENHYLHSFLAFVPALCCDTSKL